MSKNLRLVGARRGELVEKAAAQRERLGRSLEIWHRPLTVADRGLEAVRFVSNHPAWILGGALVPALVRPAQAGSWLRRGLLAFQLVSRVRAARLKKRAMIPAEPSE